MEEKAFDTGLDGSVGFQETEMWVVENSLSSKGIDNKSKRTKKQPENPNADSSVQS